MIVHLGASSPPQMDSEPKADSREWELDAETEYRFELDPGTSLAIKVRPADECLTYPLIMTGPNFNFLARPRAGRSFRQ